MLVDTGSSGLVIPWQALGLERLPGALRPIRARGPHQLRRERLQRRGGLHLSDVRQRDSRSTATAPDPHECPCRCGDLVLADIVELAVVTSRISFGQRCNRHPGYRGRHCGSDRRARWRRRGTTGVTVDVPARASWSSVRQPGRSAIATVAEPRSPTYPNLSMVDPVAVSDDVDSGGVYGTIPSSLESGTLPCRPGDTITVYDSARYLLYSYTTGTDSVGDMRRRWCREPRSTAASCLPARADLHRLRRRHADLRLPS